ncbi:MAG: tRNA pseudouridine(55) synthase TruB, partial [Acidobacteria bacterium]|nr:tRNA pseudouridine(55) synthase TruB [Acidobacteriota bacterium]
YIRTLAEAIGERLGAAAHLAALRRTRAGGFRIEDAVSLGALEERAVGGDPESFLIPADAALSDLPFVHLTAEEASRTLHGIALPLRAGTSQALTEGAPVRMRAADGRLIAVGFYDAVTSSVRPRVVLPVEK